MRQKEEQKNTDRKQGETERGTEKYRDRKQGETERGTENARKIKWKDRKLYLGQAWTLYDCQAFSKVLYFIIEWGIQIIAL